MNIAVHHGAPPFTNRRESTIEYRDTFHTDEKIVLSQP